MIRKINILKLQALHSIYNFLFFKLFMLRVNNIIISSFLLVGKMENFL